MARTKKKGQALQALPGALGVPITAAQREILRVLEQRDRAKRKDRAAAVKRALEYARQDHGPQRLPTPDETTRRQHLPAIPAGFPMTASDTAREFLAALRQKYPTRSLRLIERGATGGDVVLKDAGPETLLVGVFRYEKRQPEDKSPHGIRFAMNEKNSALDVAVYRPPRVAGLSRGEGADQGAILRRLRMARCAIAAKIDDAAALVKDHPRSEGERPVESTEKA